MTGLIIGLIKYALDEELVEADVFDAELLEYLV